MNNKSKNKSMDKMTELHNIKDQLRVLALSEENSEFKRRLLSMRNQMSNLIEEMENEQQMGN